MVANANNSWKPIEHVYIKNHELRKQIHEQGFSVQNLIPESAIQQLKDLFYEYHKLENEKGGVFFSIFSQNIDYRKAIHDKIYEIIHPIIDPLFQDYKIVLNSFVVKVSGPDSEFYIHQDTTSLDESKYSALTLWIPLHNVNTNNGCLGLVPYSKHFFSPYRSISFPAPYEGIRETIKNYLKPIEMTKGEMLLFDNRTLHHSYRNLSGKPRISVICGLFPKDARIISCTKPKYEFGGKFEVIEHEDNYLLTGKNFLKDNDKRPETGRSLGWLDDPYQAMDSFTFEELCRKYGVEKNAFYVNSISSNCNIIGEPE